MAEVQLKTKLYTAKAISTGGRNGHVENADRVVNLELSIPKSMGGPGKEKTTTPEDLFAAGYAACFGSACDFVAKSILKLSPSHIEVHSAVTVGQTEQGGFGLAVNLQVKIGGLGKEDAHKLVAKAHEICPYSNAVRGNVSVNLETIV